MPQAAPSARRVITGAGPEPKALESSLDRLLQSGSIFDGDYRAGRELAFIAQRRNYPRYRDRFAAALDVLGKSGARAMIEAVVLDGQMPRSARGLRQVVDGLHALHEHFRRDGLPIVLHQAADGGRPVIKLKRQR